MHSSYIQHWTARKDADEPSIGWNQGIKISIGGGNKDHCAYFALAENFKPLGWVRDIHAFLGGCPHPHSSLLAQPCLQILLANEMPVRKFGPCKRRLQFLGGMFRVAFVRFSNLI